MKSINTCLWILLAIAGTMFFAGCPGLTDGPEPSAPAHVWTQWNTSGVRPDARFMHAMDWAGGTKMILFGGSTNAGDSDETWEYDVSTHAWTQYNVTGTKPAARYDHAMAYAGGSKMILFGGAGPRYDTWEYDAATHTWTEYVFTGIGAKPAGRYEHAMAWAGGSKVILFGGSAYGGTQNDTWLYDASAHTWTEVVIAGSKPDARRVHALAYGGDGKVVLFGGYVYGSEQMNDTWEFDVHALTWTKITVTGAQPAPRQEHGMAWAGGRKILLYGGRDGTYVPVDPDWEYDLVTQAWTRFNIGGTTPYQRREHSLAYAGGSSVMVFGGMSDDGLGHIYDETWECRITE